MRDAVCLASGGLDSSVCLSLMIGQGLSPLALFINYGQLNHDRELEALRHNCRKFGLPDPIELDFSDFGKRLATGLTSEDKDIVNDAFTPCRNLLFVVGAAAIANQRGINKIVLGLLSVETIIFPDQTDTFVSAAQNAISEALGVSMQIILPLREYKKQDVVVLAKALGVSTYYSCHAGTDPPCGECIACREYGG